MIYFLLENFANPNSEFNWIIMVTPFEHLFLDKGRFRTPPHLLLPLTYVMELFCKNSTLYISIYLCKPTLLPIFEKKLRNIDVCLTGFQIQYYWIIVVWFSSLIHKINKMYIRRLPFKRQSYKMVKYTQTICRQFADEWFECVWPFCQVGA